MNRITSATLFGAVFGLILLVSVGAVSAQKTIGGGTGPLWEDTAINPHDFTNAYYWSSGVVAKSLLNRRTGSDGLSVFGNSSNPIHRNVRVTATIPAYDQDGNILFWYPLGEMTFDAFTPDKNGIEAAEMARLFPMYVFPHSKLQDLRMFQTTRQAALIDNSWPLIMGQDYNPLGLRQVFFVTFTEKAFTKEGYEMMNYMGKKNGMGADDTPILRTVEDVRTMMKYDLVRTAAVKGLTTFAVAPVIIDPTSGVIAQDAFLWFATKDGSPLPTEEMFAYQFGCLKKTGYWCKQ